jgi:glutamine synthetase
VAGILAHLPALAAVTTPSVASYFRLTPGRWAPTVADVGAQDRGASLRICPGPGMDVAGGYNVEVRVADATACPYMALGVLVHAGVDGVERELRLADVPERPLPSSLGEALDLLRATGAAAEWFGAEFLELYLKFKAEEVEGLEGVAPQEICDRYAAVY